jgi:tetratricopeptide (TPR) repeat protein
MPRPTDPPLSLPPGRWETVDPKDLPELPITADRALNNPTQTNKPQTIVSAQDLGGTEIPDFGLPDTELPLETNEPKPAIRLERRQELETQLRSNPTNLPAFLELATIYRHADRPIEAKRVLKQALEVFPSDSNLRWEFEEAVLARSLQQLREVGDLATRLKTPETERELKRAQQDWAQRRIEVCRSRIERDASLVHLNLPLGEAYFDAEQYDDAIEVLRRIIDRDDLSATAYLIIGKSLLAESKDVEAMAALRACGTRRSVVAPARIRVVALRLLCDTAHRLGTGVTLDRYKAALVIAEKELVQAMNANPSVGPKHHAGNN